MKEKGNSICRHRALSQYSIWQKMNFILDLFWNLFSSLCPRILIWDIQYPFQLQIVFKFLTVFSSISKHRFCRSAHSIGEKDFAWYYTVAVYSWSIANNFVIDVYCRCLEILCQIAFSSIANYFRSYRKKQFGIKSVGIYSRRL